MLIRSSGGVNQVWWPPTFSIISPSIFLSISPFLFFPLLLNFLFLVSSSVSFTTFFFFLRQYFFCFSTSVCTCQAFFSLSILHLSLCFHIFYLPLCVNIIISLIPLLSLSLSVSHFVSFSSPMKATAVSLICAKSKQSFSFSTLLLLSHWHPPSEQKIQITISILIRTATIMQKTKVEYRITCRVSLLK